MRRIIRVTRVPHGGADATDAFVSIASCREMAIQVTLGKLTLAAPIDRFVPDHLAVNSVHLLELHVDHAAAVSTMPFHHRDPFDRLLAAQAAREKLAIVSADRVFRRYGVKRIW